MHEMSIVQGIWASVLPTLDAGAYTKLLNVEVTIGEYLGVVKESLDLCWEAITMEDPRAVGSTLIISQEPAVARCNQCQKTWLFMEDWYICPDCGISDSVVESGKALHVDRIEVE